MCLSAFIVCEVIFHALFDLILWIMARGNDRGDGELDGFKIYLDQETDCVVRLDWENEK